MSQVISKVCRLCGQDVSRQPRTKDALGNYYCQPCYAQATAREANTSEATASDVARKVSVAHHETGAMVTTQQITKPMPLWRRMASIVLGLFLALGVLGLIIDSVVPDAPPSGLPTASERAAQEAGPPSGLPPVSGRDDAPTTPPIATAPSKGATPLIRGADRNSQVLVDSSLSVAAIYEPNIVRGDQVRTANGDWKLFRATSDAIFLGPEGSVAWVTEVPEGKSGDKVVVVNGERSEPYSEVLTPEIGMYKYFGFPANSRMPSFIAARKDRFGQSYLLVHQGQETRLDQIPGGARIDSWEMTQDGRTWAYFASWQHPADRQMDNPREIIAVVLNGKSFIVGEKVDGGYLYGTKPLLLLSEDGGSVAMKIKFGTRKYVDETDALWVNGRVVAKHPHIQDVSFTSRGELRFTACDKKGRLLFTQVGTKRYQAVGRDVPVISPDCTRVIYIRQREEKMHVDFGTSLGREYDKVSQFEFAPQGDRTAYVATDAARRIHCVVVDKDEGATFGSFSNITFSSDGKQVAYIGYSDDFQGGTQSVVLNHVAHPQFDEVSPPVFSSSGDSIAYAARRGQHWHLVVDGVPTEPSWDMIYSPRSWGKKVPRVTYDSTRAQWRFVALSNETIWQVSVPR